MDIRPARMQDAPEIAVVHVRSWQDAYRGLLPQAYLDGLLLRSADRPVGTVLVRGRLV